MIYITFEAPGIISLSHQCNVNSRFKREISVMVSEGASLYLELLGGYTSPLMAFP